MAPHGAVSRHSIPHALPLAEGRDSGDVPSMQTILPILNAQVTLFLLLLAGAAGKKWGVITPGFSDGLSKCLAGLVLPCSILSAFTKGTAPGLLRQSVWILGIMVGVHLFYIVLGSVLYRSADSRRKPVLKFAVLCPNTNFMGMPVIGSIYGDAGVLLLSIALIPVRAFIMTVGISYFVTGEGRRSWLRVLKNPAVWAVVLGAAMLGLGLRFPEPLNQALSSLGACTTQKDGAFAAECVIFSTLLSILTIPLINLACTCLA